MMRQVETRHGHAVRPPRDARPRGRRRQGARHHRAATWSPASSSATSPTPCCLATGGYGTVYYLSTNAVNSNVTAAWRAHKRGAFFANPCFTQIHPTCIPVSGDASVEADADEREPAQRRPRLGAEDAGRHAAAAADPGSRARLLPRAQLPELRQPRARATSPRATPRRCATRAAASARAASPSTSTSRTPSSGSATTSIRARYGNLFEMYEKITDEDPYKVPMRIYPAVHYTMGGLWVDYNLMSTMPGLYVLGEANFSDHGANRLGASALMQGLADGYFVIPYTLGDYLAGTPLPNGHDRPRRVQGGRRHRSRRASTGCSPSRARRRRASSIASSAASCGTTSAWRAPTPACASALDADSAAARGVLAERLGAGRAEQPEQEPRVRRPRRRLPRVRRTAGARRAPAHANRAAATSARSSQTPDGEAQRDDEHFALRGRVGVHRASDRRRRCTRSRSSSSTCTRRSGATSES